MFWNLLLLQLKAMTTNIIALPCSMHCYNGYVCINSFNIQNTSTIIIPNLYVKKQGYGEINSKATWLLSGRSGTSTQAV